MALTYLYTHSSARCVLCVGMVFSLSSFLLYSVILGAVFDIFGYTSQESCDPSGGLALLEKTNMCIATESTFTGFASTSGAIEQKSV